LLKPRRHEKLYITQQGWSISQTGPERLEPRSSRS
jgi:hypothetical protein